MKQTNMKTLSDTRITLDLRKLIEISHAFPRIIHESPRKRSLEQAEMHQV